MRILHVIQELRTGGAERVVASLARGAVDAGHEVAIAAAPGPVAGGLPVTVFPLGLLNRRPWLVPRNAWTLRAAVRSFRPELVHAHNPGMAAVTALATRRGRRPPGLVSVHGVPEADWPATGRVLRLAGLPAVACGPGVETALTALHCRVLETISNGIGPAPPRADRRSLDREWGLTPGAPLVVAAGRLVPAKNHALAIRALAALPGAKLAIVGEGPLRSALEDEARAAGVNDRVVLAGLRSDVREVMGAADAIVLSSHAEGLPLVALEALASGTPLVATNVRGLRELLDDGRTALLVPPDDATALAAALGRVLGDRDLASALGAGGRAVAAEHSEDAMVAAYLALYEKIAVW